MAGKVTSFEIPSRFTKLSICVLTFVMLMAAGLSQATAAVVSGQSGALKALGQPIDAINNATSPDLLLVKKGGKKGKKARRGGSRKAHKSRKHKRKAHKSRRHKRRYYRSRGHRRRYYGGPSIYLSLPFYGYAPAYSYYGYRPSYGRCQYWSNRCAANWGYGNRNYYGCMRYQGCR